MEKTSNKYDVVIVGGGIAGLYCAFELLRKNANVKIGLFEMSDRLGGRIETVKLDEFFAEFGPMRFEVPKNDGEPGGQKLFLNLVEKLGIRDRLKSFTPYATAKVDMTNYKLSPKETKCKDAKELMKLGIYKLLSFYRALNPIPESFLTERTSIEKTVWKKRVCHPCW